MPTPSPTTTTTPKTPSLAQKLRALLQGTHAEAAEATESVQEPTIEAATEVAANSDSQLAQVAALQAQLDAALAELDSSKKALAENETLQAQWTESQARNAEMLALLDAYALGEPLGDDLAGLAEEAIASADVPNADAAPNSTSAQPATTFVPAEMARIAQSLR